jgi:hypothetical protein
MTHDQAFPRLAELIEMRTAASDEHALRAHVDSCPECRRRVAALERVAAGLREIASRRTPLPNELAARIRRIPAESDRRSQTLRRRLRVAIPALAAAATIGVVFAVTSATTDPRSFNVETTLAVRPMSSAETSGRIDVSPAHGQFRIVRLDIRGLPAGAHQTYDLWMMDGDGAMKAGTFGPDPDGHCEVELMVPAGEEWSHMVITESGVSPKQRMLAGT